MPSRSLCLLSLASGIALGCGGRSEVTEATNANAGADASVDARPTSLPTTSATPPHPPRGRIVATDPKPYRTDAGVCVDIGPSLYAQACTTLDDCVAVSAGTLCDSNCIGACPNAAINVADRDRYMRAVSVVHPSVDCHCDAIPDPDVTCTQGLCEFHQSFHYPAPPPSATAQPLHGAPFGSAE